MRISAILLAALAIAASSARAAEPCTEEVLTLFASGLYNVESPSLLSGLADQVREGQATCSFLKSGGLPADLKSCHTIAATATYRIEIQAEGNTTFKLAIERSESSSGRKSDGKLVEFTASGSADPRTRIPE